MNKLPWILVAWLMLGSASVAAQAAGAETGVAWESLDETTQELLAGQKAQWNTLPPARRARRATNSRRSVTPCVYSS